MCDLLEDTAVLDEIHQNESDVSDDVSNRCNYVKGLLDKLIEIVRMSVESGEFELFLILNFNRNLMHKNKIELKVRFLNVELAVKLIKQVFSENNEKFALIDRMQFTQFISFFKVFHSYLLIQLFLLSINFI